MAATLISTPALQRDMRRAAFPSHQHWNPRCPNKVRYEMLKRLGYFVTESSEHFAEYTPYFIKEGREDLIEKFGIPLDEYPKRCIEQIARWKEEAEAYRKADTIEVKASHEYASAIVNSVWTGRAFGHLWQCAQQWLHHLAAGWMRRGSAVPCRRPRHPANLHRRSCRRNSPR